MTKEIRFSSPVLSASVWHTNHSIQTALAQQSRRRLATVIYRSAGSSEGAKHRRLSLPRDRLPRATATPQVQPPSPHELRLAAHCRNHTPSPWRRRGARSVELRMGSAYRPHAPQFWPGIVWVGRQRWRIPPRVPQDGAALYFKK